MIGIVLICCLLCSCTLWQSASHQSEIKEKTENDNTSELGSAVLTHEPDLTIAELNSNKQGYIPTVLSERLLKREEYCQLSKAEQTNRMEALSRQDSTDANIELLMLASCKPHMTPGIMRNALVRLKKKKELPKEFQSFFAIMMAQLNASEQLARQQQALIDQLNTTVEELTKIEKDIESRDSQNKAMEPFNS